MLAPSLAPGWAPERPWLIFTRDRKNSVIQILNKDFIVNSNLFFVELQSYRLKMHHLACDTTVLSPLTFSSEIPGRCDRRRVVTSALWGWGFFGKVAEAAPIHFVFLLCGCGCGRLHGRGESSLKAEEKRTLVSAWRDEVRTVRDAVRVLKSVKQLRQCCCLSF